jgi:hypothetical protein
LPRLFAPLRNPQVLNPCRCDRLSAGLPQPELLPTRKIQLFQKQNKNHFYFDVLVVASCQLTPRPFAVTFDQYELQMADLSPVEPLRVTSVRFDHHFETFLFDFGRDVVGVPAVCGSLLSHTIGK